MEYVREIKKLVDELVNLRLNKGVTPTELMENIYNRDYTEIKAKRHLNNLICFVNFYDTEFFGEKRVKYQYIYIYNQDNYLQEIQQLKKKNKEIIWNRETEESNLLESIVRLLRKIDDSEAVDKFNLTLPKDLKEMIDKRKSKIS